MLLLWLSAAAAPVVVNDPVVGLCVPRDSFVKIGMSVATTVRSNLGGQGGRCHLGVIPDGCEIPVASDPPAAGSSPHEIYLRDIGRNDIHPQYQPHFNAAAGQFVDMRITNLTEYYAWNTRWNGVKIGRDGTTNQFAVVNLLGPRSDDMPGRIWNNELTFVELNVEFLGRTVPWDEHSDPAVQAVSATPLTLARTYISFYDFDTGSQRSDGTFNAPEAMQVDSSATTVALSSATELEQHGAWSTVSSEAQLNSFFPAAADRARLEAWTSPIIRATTYGVGRDNPADSYTITPLQQARSVQVLLSASRSARLPAQRPIWCPAPRPV